MQCMDKRQERAFSRITAFISKLSIFFLPHGGLRHTQDGLKIFVNSLFSLNTTLQTAHICVTHASQMSVWKLQLFNMCTRRSRESYQSYFSVFIW